MRSGFGIMSYMVGGLAMTIERRWLCMNRTLTIPDGHVMSSMSMIVKPSHSNRASGSHKLRKVPHFMSVSGRPSNLTLDSCPT